MNPYKILRLEFNGIKNLIKQYTSDAVIINYLNELDYALDTDDIDIIEYCTEEICNWYQRNISKIEVNPLVHNIDEHKRNFAFLLNILKKFEKFNNNIEIEKDNDLTEKPIEQIKLNLPKIFLSHCSANKKFGDALQKLITGLGIENDKLIYSSHPLHKIPVGENIYEYLRMNIYQDVFVIILWSNEYLKSPACLNEMGAAWVTQTDYINLYTPDFAFGNPKYHQCAVDTRKMGAVLNGDENCKASMIEFKNKIIEMFDLTVDEQKSSYLLDQFMKDIK